MCLKLNQPCINLLSVCRVRHSWIGNNTENFNYNSSKFPNKNWFRQIFIFFQNYQKQRESTEGKGKRKKERNDDKKKNQIRIFPYQLYPIYKIKYSKNNKFFFKKNFKFTSNQREAVLIDSLS